MLLKDILQVKGRDVYTVDPDASLQDVVERLMEHRCGSLVVCRDGEMVGIITERDILRACARTDAALADAPVSDHMTREVITGTPEDDVETIMGLMTDHRIRHLPVLQQGKLAGIISIGDVVKAQHDRLSVENHFLKRYIQS